MVDFKTLATGVSESQVLRRVLNFRQLWFLKTLLFKFSSHGAERCAHAPCSPATEEPEWTVGVRRAVRGGTLRSRPLCYISYCAAQCPSRSSKQNGRKLTRNINSCRWVVCPRWCVECLAGACLHWQALLLAASLDSSFPFVIHSRPRNKPSTEALTVLLVPTFRGWGQFAKPLSLLNWL